MGKKRRIADEIRPEEAEAPARPLPVIDSGSGNYTEERYAWLEGETIEGIVERIRRREA